FSKLSRWAWPAGLFVAALAMRVGSLYGQGFDGLYGQDPYAYYRYAIGPLREALLQLEAPPPFFWPPGYPLLVAVLSLVIGQTPLAGQLVSLVGGALVPVLTTLLARQLFPAERLLPILAGLAVAVCGQLWQSSIVVMADTTGLALATFSAFAIVRYARTQHLGWLLAGSAALAFAILARWIYGLAGLAFGGYALVSLSHLERRRALAHAAAALGLGATLLLPVLGLPLLGLLSHPTQPASFAGNLQVYSWSPLNALRRDFITADGHLSYAQRNGMYYALAPANLAYFGPFLAPWAAVGLWPALTMWRRPTLLLVVGWAAVVYAFHAGAAWQNFRFTLAYLPPLAILVAAGLTWTWQRVDGWLKLPVAVCAALGVMTAAVGAGRLVESFVDRKADDLALVRWVDAQTEPDARLLSFGPTLTLRYYADRTTFDLFDLSPAEVSAVVAEGLPLYVLVDEANLEQQWAGRTPADNVARLQDGPGLTPRGAYGPYTLFAVSK
ncbi:MAG TPA: glycosyltransferase family 39 protein, partial [Chloroflexota bacterium]